MRVCMIDSEQQQEQESKWINWKTRDDVGEKRKEADPEDESDSDNDETG